MSLPKRRAGPPRRSRIRATPELLVLSHKSIRKIFSGAEMKHLTPAPWFEVQGVPCFKSNVKSSSAITEARRPVLLSRDDPQGREARFSHNGETRPKVLPIGELSWLHTERREEGIQARLPDSCNLFSLLKKLVKLAWREASSASRQSASLPSTRTGVSHTNGSILISLFCILYFGDGEGTWR